jgi:hypothetical protein
MDDERAGPKWTLSTVRRIRASRTLSAIGETPRNGEGVHHAIR